MDATLRDLADDFTELQTLAAAAAEKLLHHRQRLEAHPGDYRADSHAYLLRQTLELAAAYEQLAGDMRARLNESGTWTEADAARLLREKKKYYDLLRIQGGLLGGTLSAGNWQSPSFAHTELSQAGAEEGDIAASVNDYKRDTHTDEQTYGKRFAAEYLDRGLRLPLRVFATSSGMAALTTVLHSLIPKVGAQGVVLAGKASYFQNKWMLENTFPGRVVYVDEFDTAGIIQKAQTLRPGAIFLDSLCGAEELPMPNLSVLIPALAAVLPHGSTLVLDTTGTATMLQPLRYLPLRPLGMHLMVIESLLKYHQFGLDRVGGGVVWGTLGCEQGLYTARMHAGTIIPDGSVLALPAPNRELLDKRLLRVGRNARLLAERLDRCVRGEGSVLSHIVHPSLPHYPGYAWTKELPFHGGFVVLAFKEKFKHAAYYDRFLAKVMAAARQRGVGLVGGTSFGFNTTRIYVTARYATNLTKPFVRISAGTETLAEVDALAEVLESVINE